jgi:hypothetical protein
MTVDVEDPPATAPSPRDSLRMRVHSYDFFHGKHVGTDVQFLPPCLVQWTSNSRFEVRQMALPLSDALLLGLHLCITASYHLWRNCQDRVQLQTSLLVLLTQ